MAVLVPLLSFALAFLLSGADTSVLLATQATGILIGLGFLLRATRWWEGWVRLLVSIMFVIVGSGLVLFVSLMKSGL